jgi:small subunit ribosomal protein S6
MKQTNRNYRATFIIDNRGKEDSVEQIIAEVKNEISTLSGEIAHVEDLGKRDFIRVTDKKLTGAPYVQITYSAPGSAPAQLLERLRLNHNIYRTFIQSV